MHPRRIMVAANDSSAGLAAARFAVALAAGLGGRVRFVHVVGDGQITGGLAALRREHAVDERRRQGAADLLRHLLAIAAEAGVEADAEHLQGPVAPLLLAQVRDWGADLVVLGRVDRPGPGTLPVGRLTRYVLEFCECPVLVVPVGGDRGARFGDPPTR